MTFSEWLNQNYDEPGPLRYVAFLLECLAGAALMMLMLVTCFDVIGRYFFDSPIQGASEITEIGIALVVFSQMPKITWSGGHVVVDILDRFMQPIVIRLLGTFSAIIISASFYFLAVRIWELAARSIRRNETTEYLGFSVGIIVQYIAIMSWVTAAGVLTWGIIRLWTTRKPQQDAVEG